MDMKLEWTSREGCCLIWLWSTPPPYPPIQPQVGSGQTGQKNRSHRLKTHWVIVEEGPLSFVWSEIEKPNVCIYYMLIKVHCINWPSSSNYLNECLKLGAPDITNWPSLKLVTASNTEIIQKQANKDKRCVQRKDRCGRFPRVWPQPCRRRPEKVPSNGWFAPWRSRRMPGRAWTNPLWVKEKRTVLFFSMHICLNLRASVN